MEDLFPVLILIIYSVVAAVLRKGQKKEKKKAAKKTERRAEFTQAFAENTKRKDKPSPSPERTIKPAVSNPACEEKRLHLHEVTNAQMEVAEEGEDPCHAGNAPAAHGVDLDDYAAATEQDDGLAQDVLRGIIMSEILTRPSERAALRRNKRSAI